MERYRSGHNGADSKSVCAQAHEGSNPSLSANKKRTFVYRQRCVFWMMFAFGKWWRLRLMMFASRMMRGFATFYGKHRIIAERSGATSYLRSKCIISPQAMHHLTNLLKRIKGFLMIKSLYVKLLNWLRKSVIELRTFLRFTYTYAPFARFFEIKKPSLMAWFFSFSGWSRR